MMNIERIDVRKPLVTILILLMLTMAGCGKPSAGTLTGSASDIMTQLRTAIATALPADGVPKTEEVPLTADVATQVGLTAAQFTDLVVDGTISRALIMTVPHEMVLIRAKDAAAATQLKAAIASTYDPKKWICVFPEQASVVESGQYVLLIAGTKVYATAALDSFAKLAGTSGTINTFFTGAG